MVPSRGPHSAGRGYGLCTVTSSHHVTRRLVLSPHCFYFYNDYLPVFLSFLILLLFSRKRNAVVTKGEADFYETKICYVLVFTLNEISEEHYHHYHLLRGPDNYSHLNLAY